MKKTAIVTFVVLFIISCQKEKAIQPTTPGSTTSVTRSFMSAHAWRLVKMEADVALDTNGDGLYNINLNNEKDSCTFNWYYLFRTDSIFEEHLDNVACGGPYSDTWIGWWWLSNSNDSIFRTEGNQLVTKLTFDSLIIRSLEWDNSIDTTTTITYRYVKYP